MIVFVAILVTALIAVSLYLGLNLCSYYWIDGVGKALETIEEPDPTVGGES